MSTSTGNVTNRDIIEKEKQEGVTSCIQFIKSLSEKHLAYSSIRTSVNLLVKKYKLLIKSKSRAGIPDKITELLNAKYCFSNPQAIRGRKRKLDPVFDNQNTCLNDSLKDVAIDVARNLNDSIENEKKLKFENEDLKVITEEKV